MMLLMDGMLVLILHLREAALSTELTELLAKQGATAEQMQPYLTQITDAGNSWNMQRGIVALFLGYGVLTSLTLLFSTFTSGTIVSMIFGLGAYFLGMFRHQLFSGINAGMGGEGTSEGMRWAEQVASVILPDFSIFNVADTTSAGVALTGGMLGALALIAVGYMLLHLLVSTLIFSRKEF